MAKYQQKGENQMIIIKNGDLLKGNENIIVHQVNVDGIMRAEEQQSKQQKNTPKQKKNIKNFVKNIIFHLKNYMEKQI